MSSDRADGHTTGRTAAPSRDVAVIGMAVRLPEADDLDRFAANLRAGRDSVREMPAERRTRTSLPVGEAYQIGGYLDDIDEFDHAFFDLSRGEANNMAPQHRLLMQTAHHAVENAGYDPGSWRGTRGSVYVADTRINYDELAAVAEPTLVMGSHFSATAGRLARLFGLRGPAAMIDTSCSSSLVALHLAINDLLLGDAEVALVGCASLDVKGDLLTGETDIGIRSADGRTRCFSADADGTGAGEAVAAVLLKRLDHALRDDDVVHAVVKGVAVNNVGGRSSTLTAPDPDAEAEVIERAWAVAGIDPRTVTYIEAHGTATRLGDPIEIEAIDTAFARHTAERRFCALSSVKSNLGHTWSAAGLVGLVKAVLALRHRTLFPNLHSERPSPLIDFDRSAVTVTTRTAPWEPGCGIRRAGVSSFGVMGTNAHAVLEEAPPRPPRAAVPGPFWLPVSARSAGSLMAGVAALRDHLDSRPELALADVAHTLIAGRTQHEYRFGVLVDDHAALAAALDAAAPDPGPPAPPDELVLVVSGAGGGSAGLTAQLRADHPVFDERFTACERAAADPGDPRVARFAFRYAAAGLLRAAGLRFAQVVGEGSGSLVVAADRGRTPLAEALHRACTGPGDGVPADLDARVDTLLGRFPGRRVRFVEAGPLSTVTAAVAARQDSGYRATGAEDRAGGVARIWRDLHADGVSWDWAVTAGPGRRVELPGYRFERTRCWITDLRRTGTVQRARAAGTDTGGPVDAAAVAALYQEVLDSGPVAEDANFFTLGGDSIGSLDLVALLTARFGVDPGDTAVFDHGTPAALAAHIGALRSGAPATTPAAERATTPPEVAAQEATAAQRQVWLACQFEGGSVAFNLTRTFRVTGRVDVDALRGALTGLTTRHDALRSRFAFRDGAVTVDVVPDAPAPLTVTDLDRALPGDDEIAEAVRPFASRPFDLAAGPLLRAQMLRLPGEQAVLTLSTHHIVADGWSLDVLVRDLADGYAAHTAGRPAPAPGGPGHREYREYRQREHERDAAGRRDAERYWLDRFATLPAPLDLPARDGRSRSFRGHYRSYTLPGPAWARLTAFARDEGGTPFGCLLSLFAALLAPYSEQGDVVLGTSLAGRTGPGADQVVGMLVRTVPLRVRAWADRSLRAVFASVRTAFRDAVAHLAYPYEDLVGALRGRALTSAPDLFDVLIEFEQFSGAATPPHAALAGAGLRATPVEVGLETSVFPLNIMLSEQDGGLTAVVRYDTGAFDTATVDRLWRSFTDLTEILLDAPDTPMSGLPLLGPHEQRRVRTLGARHLDVDHGLTIPLAIARTAATAPDRECLAGPDGRRTFGELHARTNRLARHLRGLGVAPGELVALVMDRSVLTVESILALWKCGAAYLPVDPGHPPAFVREMLGQAGVRVVLTDPRQEQPGLTARLRGEWVVEQVTEATGAGLAAGDIGGTPDPDALAYVIYTSGSTGAPKGAMVEQRGMLNHLHAKIADLGLTAHSVVAQNASNGFDISLWQMFAAPFAGGRTVVYEPAAQLEPVRFAQRVVADGVTVLEVVPSYLDALLDAVRRSAAPVGLDALTHLMVTGEAVLPPLVARWFRAFPGVPVVNAYGPTEASDDITHHVLTGPVEGPDVPLGRPIPNVEVYVLDEHDRVVPQGVRGQICVSGVCVGRGYRNAPEQTARVFTSDPFRPGHRMYRTGDGGRWDPDGTLRFLGRSDSQIKIRGYRVDLGEVERRALGAPGVTAAAVVQPAPDRLCAYVVTGPGGSAAGCRAHLGAELPGYMVPADVVELDRLPLTPNGKIDRQALRSRGVPAAAGTGAGARPASDAERAVAEVWESVLGRGIDLHTRFLDVGGNSLRAIQVISRLRERLGTDVTLDQLFAHPTVAELSALVGTAARDVPGDPLPRLGGPGRYPVGPTQHLLLRLERDLARRDAFARNDLHRVTGPLDPELLDRAFAAVARRHETLRTTFDDRADPPRQVVHAPGELPSILRTHDLRTTGDADDVVRDLLRRPFELDTQAPVRADLLRTGPSGHLLLVSMHQLVSDGRSARVLHDDLLRAYDRLAAGLDPDDRPDPVQDKDASAWRAARLTAERIEWHRRFWAAELDGATSAVALPTDRSRPERSVHPGARVHLDVPAELAAGIAGLARGCGVTEFVVARTALTLLLCGLTGTGDITVGTYTRGRDRSDLEDVVGFRINTVALRLRVLPGSDVRSLLAEAQRGQLAAFEHQEYPYGWIMRDLGWERGPDRAPLFDVMIALDDHDEDTDTVHTLRLDPLEIPRRAKEADVQVVFARGADRLELVLTYDTGLFDRDRIERFGGSLRGVLAAMADQRPVAEILGAVRA